jgi:L-cysteate sulfo-lyase
MQLARFARSRFCHTPTPFEPLPALTKHLGGPTIFVKRDDCTGLALGGNKNRKLEFILGEALQSGADTLVTAGGVQSNHCRQTAAAAARHGLKCELVLSRQVASNHPAYERTGNVLLDRLFGARLNFVSRDIKWDDELARVAEEVRGRGGKPFIVPLGGSTPTGTLGYVGCAQELLQQADDRGVGIDAIVHCSGSGATQAGLIVGLEGAASPVPVTGISVARPAAQLIGEVADLVDRTAEKVGLGRKVPHSRIEVTDRYIGPGYGLPTQGMLEAVDMMARLEGIVLDPVYTGKTLAGLIDMVRQGRFKKGQNVVFIHTGGVPAIFAYDDIMTEGPGDIAA